MNRLLISLLTTLFLAAGNSQAAISFKSSSALSSGNWVKVKIAETGIYEISYDQLREYGFSNPENVVVMGNGGYPCSDNLWVAYVDDLEPAPMLREGGKIYFYGKGVTQEEITVYSTANSQLYNKLTSNPYSSESYYFLTDRSDIEPFLVSSSAISTSDTDIENISSWKEYGIDYWNHEQELINIGRSGKLFFGEDFSASGTLELEVPMPLFVDGGQIQVYATSAIKTSSKLTASVYVNGEEAAMKTNNEIKANNSDDSVFFTLYTSYSVLSESSIENERTTVKLAYDKQNLLIGRLNYVSVGFDAKNAIPADSAMARRVYTIDSQTGVSFSGANSTTHAWLVNDSQATVTSAYDVKEYALNTGSDGVGRFVTDIDASWGEFVYFDTSKPQKQPEFVEAVENQDIHAEDTPNMLIITTAELKEQAERIADYHREHDGYSVLVLDHRLIFNEFSQGVPDAMAYRRIGKMFYDRASAKFRYVLLVGGGTYDNRQINTKSNTDMLLTYQTEESSHEVNSYCTDDIFVCFSEDNKTLTNLTESIPIGRIQFKSVSDTKQYVDKLLAYMEAPYDSTTTWHNNFTMYGEYGDDYIHTTQCEEFESLFNAEDVYDVNFTKIYMEVYNEEVDTRTKFVEELEKGQYFVLFIGHSNIATMTKALVLMDLQKAQDTKYEIPPIMYVSSCDIGRYDIGQSTIVDNLMLNSEGGIIASIAATREAYTNLNGKMTNAFASQLGKAASDFPLGMTIGKLLLEAKYRSQDATRNRLKYNLLGDPAMPIAIAPRGLEITEIDGTAIEDGTTVEVGALQKVKVTGRVLNSSGATDTSFNGYVKATLFDSTNASYMTYTQSGVSTKAAQRGEELYSTGTQATNGVFTAEIIIPTFTTDDTLAKPLFITAVGDDGATLYTNKFELLYFDRDLSEETEDTTPPTINAMYIDSKDTFKDGGTVADTFKIYAEVTDDNGVNLTKEVVTVSSYILLDGSDSYAISSCTYGSDGKAYLHTPVYGLASGYHTAELVVADMAGNVSSRTIAFFVESDESEIALTVEEAAINDTATFDIESDEAQAADAELYVVTDAGDVVYSASGVTFPYVWDAVGDDGTRVADGVYNAYAVINGVGTTTKKIVVVKQ